ncbi:MAG TPA: sigma factor-like helix-turn-helix DNA-binding protein, partial [Polyangiales bacterium]|nr:sigma factor-like helix-turn-helix DNA-binding protein [Polyangiales bacterium]
IHAANKHRRRERVDRLRHSEASPEHVASENADPTRTLQSQQELARLQLALDRLPDELRTTLVLVEIEGESCLSVAAALGWPVGTVYWRLHEARKKLQLALRSTDGARAQRSSSASQPALPERRRALRVPNLGIIMLFSDSLFRQSEAGRLLRLAREQPSTLGATDALLARHRELVQAGADLPAWAASYVPQSASWLGLIGLGGTGAIAVVAAAGLAAALLLGAPERRAVVQHDQTPQPAEAAADARVAPAPVTAPVPAPVPAPVLAAAPRSAASLDRAATAEQAADELAAPDQPHAVTAHASAAHRAASRAPLREPKSAPAAAQPIDASDENESQRRAPAPPSAAQAERPEDPADNALREMQEIASAERLLATAPARALSIVRSVGARFPQGYLREERAYVEVMALLALGRSAEARSKAEDFLEQYPDGPYSRRVHGAAAATGR